MTELHLTLTGSSETFDVLSRYDPKIWIISIIVIAAYIFEGILLAKGFFRVQTRNAKRVKEAQRRGHVVTAYLFKDYSQTYIDPDETQAAVYKYIVDGNEYKFNFCEKQKPPQTITLFYLDNPKKTFRRGEEYVNLGCFAAAVPILLGVALTFLMSVDTK